MFSSRPATIVSQDPTLEETNVTKRRTSKLILKYGLASLFAIILLALLVFAGFSYFEDPNSSASKVPLLSSSVKSTPADIASNIADLSVNPPLEFLSKIKQKPIVFAGIVLFVLATLAVIITVVLVTMKSSTPTLEGDEIHGGDLVIGNDEPPTQITTDEENFMQKYWYVGVSIGLIILIIIIALIKYLVPSKGETRITPHEEKSRPILEEDLVKEKNAEFFKSPPKPFTFDRTHLVEVGKGSTCYVYKIQVNNVPLALKCMKENFEYLLDHEVAILKKIGGHLNVIRGPVYLKKPVEKEVIENVNEEIDEIEDEDSYESDDEESDEDLFEMALEFFPHTLDHFYENHLKVPADERILAYIAYCVINGLDRIHRLNIIHKDIKPQSLGVSEEGVVKLFDFGYATEFPESFITPSPFKDENLRDALSGQGTRVFMAPEVFQRCYDNSIKVSGKADIYSLGMTLLSLIMDPWKVYGFESKEEATYMGLYKIAKDKGLDKLLEGTLIPGVSKSFKDFLQKCLKYDQLERSSAADLKGHDFLKERCRRQDLLDRLPKVIKSYA